MTNRSILRPKHIGWTLFLLSLTLFVFYHVWTFSEYENALYQPWLR